MNYCTKYSELCDNANASGYCKLSACTKLVACNNTYLSKAPKEDDGIYMQLFCVKDGVRYDMKVIDLKDVSTILTNSLMDGIEKLCK